MQLNTLIKILERLPPEREVMAGFGGTGHCDRGYYANLAFEPRVHVRVENMLRDARAAIGITREGWKGGDFVMSETSEVFVGAGSSDCGIPVGALVVQWLVAHIAWQGDTEGIVDDAVEQLLEVMPR